MNRNLMLSCWSVDRFRNECRWLIDDNRRIRIIDSFPELLIDSKHVVDCAMNGSRSFVLWRLDSCWMSHAVHSREAIDGWCSNHCRMFVSNRMEGVL